MNRLVLASSWAILAAGTALPGTAAALDMSGRIGLGGDVDAGILGETLSLRYWVSNLGLEGLAGFSINDDDGSSLGVRLGGRVLYALTRTREVNLLVGVGLSTRIADGREGTDNPLYLDVITGPELHLDDHFAISGRVGLTVEVSGSPARTLSSAAWGAAFHFYF